MHIRVPKITDFWNTRFQKRPGFSACLATTEFQKSEFWNKKSSCVQNSKSGTIAIVRLETTTAKERSQNALWSSEDCAATVAGAALSRYHKGFDVGHYSAQGVTGVSERVIELRGVAVNNLRRIDLD